MDHPYRVSCLAHLPAGLRALVERAPEISAQANYVFVVPEQEFYGGWFRSRRVPEQALVFTPAGVLHVQSAGVGQPERTTYLPGETLLFARLTLILLSGCVELVDGHRADARIVVEYNTVGHHLLAPALLRFLRLAWGPRVSDSAADRDRTEALLFDLWRRSLKFRNGLGGYALQPDERLLGYVLQPRILCPRWRLFEREVAPASLLALTDRQLILLEETPASPRQVSYAWRFTFCPRPCVSGVDLELGKEWQRLTVRLRREVTAQHQVTLENENAHAWARLWDSRLQSKS